MSVSYVSNFTGWRGSARLYVKLVDDYCFGFGRAQRLIEVASNNQDREGILKGRVEKVTAYAEFTSFLFKSARKFTEVGVFLKNSPLLLQTTFLGFFINGLNLFKGGYAAYKQVKFISMVSKIEESTLEILEKLANLSSDELENRLQFLRKYNNEKITPDIIRDLATVIRKGDPGNYRESVRKAQKLIKDMRWQATKKLVVHALEVISAIIGIVGLIASLYGLAHIAPFLITVGLVVQLVRYLAANGWASQSSGFSYGSLKINAHFSCVKAAGIRRS